MVGSQLAKTSGTTCDHACNTCTSSLAQLIQTYGYGQLKSPCYDYVLLYTDDTLIISENAEIILTFELGCYFQLKQESIGPPQIYLGGHVQKVALENGISTWSFSASQYMQATIKNVEAYISNTATSQWKLPAKAEMPLRATYRLELDLSPELGHEDASYYQSLIGILHWIVELG